MGVNTTRSNLVSTGLAVLGAGIGFAIAWTSSRRPSEAWAVWALVATALTAASWALFPYGLRRWRELNEIGPARVADVTGRLAVVWATALLAGVAYQFASASASWRAGLLVLTVGLGALPTMATITGIGPVADRLEGSTGDRLDRLIHLRRLLQGLVAALAGIVALLVIASATGASMSRNASPATSLLFGAFMSALVAIVYLPSADRLRRRGIGLVAETLPAAGRDGDALADLVDKRSKLDVALGVDKTAFNDLQANLVVLGPLIASTGAAFLQR